MSVCIVAESQMDDTNECPFCSINAALFSLPLLLMSSSSSSLWLFTSFIRCFALIFILLCVRILSSTFFCRSVDFACFGSIYGIFFLFSTLFIVSHMHGRWCRRGRRAKMKNASGSFIHPNRPPASYVLECSRYSEGKKERVWERGPSDGCALLACTLEQSYERPANRIGPDFEIRSKFVSITFVKILRVEVEWYRTLLWVRLQILYKFLRERLYYVIGSANWASTHSIHHIKLCYFAVLNLKYRFT